MKDCRKNILIAGGAGFIGSNFVLNWLSTQNEGLINLDSLSYAADLNNLESISENKEYFFGFFHYQISELVLYQFTRL